VHYLEAYPPIVKMISIRLVLALATFHECEVEQNDVVTVFLEASIDKEVYMRLH
jgi:hypothetical protein